MESRTRVSSCLGLISWMYLHLRVDVHSGTRTQYRSQVHPADKSQTGPNACRGFHC
ncbi:unnamed protein product [Schistosoma margrebowiei]|uniref:Uncharacterized protein n=1 Tax=Schistosoma margrebowiei TaxID=48269 RepID=A0A183MG22_9TREM|nr:unnamed protein product [Schistosoma margrebowiei]